MNATQIHSQDPSNDLVEPAPGLCAGLYAPDVSGGVHPDDSIAGIISRLMSPPSFLNNDNQTVTLTITWAVGVAGPERFERLAGDDRYVLSYHDDLREQGQAAGLSPEILEWLEGGEQTLTLPASHFE
jgi:hypothetical protein